MIYLVKRFIQSLTARYLPGLRIFDRLSFGFWDSGPHPRLEKHHMPKVDVAFKFAKDNIHHQILEKCSSLNVNPPKDFIEELAFQTQTSNKKTPINFDHGFLLYSVVADLAKNRENLSILETGTARGFSSIVMSRACSDECCPLNLITLDVLPHNRSIYWNSYTDLKGKMKRSEILGRYEKYSKCITFLQMNTRISLNRLHIDHIDFAFLDGAHKYSDVVSEGRFVAQRQKPGDLIVFDDYNKILFPGIVRGVEALVKEFDYQIEIIGGKDDRFYAICRRMS